MSDRQHAHELLDRLGPSQIAAVVHLLEVIAHEDDDELTEDDRRAVAEADEWRKHNPPVPLENVLADFGLTMADWETMGKTPLPDDTGRRNG